MTHNSTFPTSAEHNLKSDNRVVKRLHQTAAQLALYHRWDPKLHQVVDGRRMINVHGTKFCHKPAVLVDSYQTFFGWVVSFHSLCAFAQHGSSSAGSGCIPPRTAADWIFCSVAQIPLNWNFQMEAFQICSRSAYHMKACDVTCPGLGLAWAVQASPKGHTEVLHKPTFISRKRLFPTYNHSWNNATWRRGYKTSQKGRKLQRIRRQNFK